MHKPKQISFANIEQIIELFSQTDHREKSQFQQLISICSALLNCIQQTPDQAFALPQVIDFIGRINTLNTLNEPFHISLFEYWLNQLSQLSNEENYFVRAKIAGKYIPRDDYQNLFPVGMNSVYSGSHYVVAHLSPDVDTMTASFWGWVDAFAAKVGTGLHHWCLPGKAPGSPITKAFQDFLGTSVSLQSLAIQTTLSLQL